MTYGIRQLTLGGVLAATLMTGGLSALPAAAQLETAVSCEAEDGIVGDRVTGTIDNTGALLSCNAFLNDFLNDNEDVTP